MHGSGRSSGATWIALAGWGRSVCATADREEDVQAPASRTTPGSWCERGVLHGMIAAGSARGTSSMDIRWRWRASSPGISGMYDGELELRRLCSNRHYTDPRQRMYVRALRDDARSRQRWPTERSHLCQRHGRRAFWRCDVQMRLLKAGGVAQPRHGRSHHRTAPGAGSVSAAQCDGARAGLRPQHRHRGSRRQHDAHGSTDRRAGREPHFHDQNGELAAHCREVVPVARDQRCTPRP